MDCARPSEQRLPTLKIGNQPIAETKYERLDPKRAVYRVGIQPFGDLPPEIIVKSQKEGWSDEFQKEIEAYAKMKDLQGKVIPRFFGCGAFGGLPALILSEINGITLRDLAHSEQSINEETMENQINAVFQSLSDCGAIYWDQRLDNFLLCDKGDHDDVQVMIVDLESVQFPATFRSWEVKVNPGGARSLMRDFRHIRYPDRVSSPVRCWGSDPGNREEESQGSVVCVRSINEANHTTVV